MNTMYISVGLLAAALLVSLVHYLKTKDDKLLPPKEPMIDLPEAFHGRATTFVATDEDVDVSIGHITRGDVRLDIERKHKKQLKSRPRKKR